MKILGLKLTHDGSYSVFENNRLLITYELEKYKNNNRFKILNSLEDLNEILSVKGYKLEDFDKIIIDGWVGNESSQIELDNGKSYKIQVAPYCESIHFKDLTKELKYEDLVYNNKSYKYTSFTHATGHILSAYMTSEFAKNNEDSYALIWDGGMCPKLYFIDTENHNITPLGELFHLGVNIYSIFAQHFGPFKINPNVIKDELSIAGKVMAYVAYGKINRDILTDLNITYNTVIKNKGSDHSIPLIPYHFSEIFLEITKHKDYSHEDIITSFHHFLGQLLLERMTQKIESDGKRSSNLCYGGGAALNIKWNSLLRNKLGLNLWVPPFPNDSGSSIGAACSELFINQKINHIDWNVYSGPSISEDHIDSFIQNDWFIKDCSIQELAGIIHTENEPILFLHSKAEIGPRALGHRSILSPAVSPDHKDKINRIKFREYYRPVAPICLEEKAKNIFNPGRPDPYMLFEHFVRDSWVSKIPSAIHEDGSSRLQTVNQSQNELLYNLLKEYEKLSGIPVLLNTSANLKGSGFFPDITSAMKWGKITNIWCDNKLYSKKIKS